MLCNVVLAVGTLSIGVDGAVIAVSLYKIKTSLRDFPLVSANSKVFGLHLTFVVLTFIMCTLALFDKKEYAYVI